MVHVFQFYCCFLKGEILFTAVCEEKRKKDLLPIKHLTHFMKGNSNSFIENRRLGSFTDVTAVSHPGLEDKLLI